MTGIPDKWSWPVLCGNRIRLTAHPFFIIFHMAGIWVTVHRVGENPAFLPSCNRFAVPQHGRQFPLVTMHKKVTAVIIAAGGAGLRMGADIPKLFLPLHGRPVLLYALAAFAAHEMIDLVCVVVPAAYRSRAEQILESCKKDLGPAEILLTHGGATRQQSVANGLRQLPAAISFVLVHDGARPLVDQDTISRTIAAVRQHGAAIAAVPVIDTLKKVREARILKTVDRTELWQAQTPQGAERGLLQQAYAFAEETGFIGTDEASLLEHASIPAVVTSGSPSNIKITGPADLLLAEVLLSRKNPHDRHGTPRIGHGYDAHCLAAGRPLVLGGVTIPHEQGLVGHSDADVLTHALCDAVLGALAKGDLGTHFPDTDPQFRGVNSLGLLEQVMAMARRDGFSLGNCDITVVAQEPKLAPYIEDMRKNIARTAVCEPQQVSIKATTTERMGFPGRGEGIAAHAVALLTPTQEKGDRT